MVLLYKGRILNNLYFYGNKYNVCNLCDLWLYVSQGEGDFDCVVRVALLSASAWVGFGECGDVYVAGVGGIVWGEKSTWQILQVLLINF